MLTALCVLSKTHFPIFKVMKTFNIFLLEIFMFLGFTTKWSLKR